jgi:PPOX class probable F420-dependent enzyme
LWFVRDGEGLIVMTAPDSSKVKRLRNNTHVVIAPCDSRGNIPAGAPRADATARLMDEAETAQAHKLMARKHLLVRLADWTDIVRRRRAGSASLSPATDREPSAQGAPTGLRPPRHRNTHDPGPSRRRWWVLVVIALAQLMVVLDATIVNIALKLLRRHPPS